MAEDIEARVILFVAAERVMREDAISRDSRLLQDLGMDGDDAFDFFEEFGAAFDVDLDGLYDDWDACFGPEGGGGPAIRAGLASLIIVGITVVVVGQAIVMPDWPLIMAGMALWFVLWFLWPVGRKPAPITVDDLIRAAEAGKWEKQVRVD